ncbi:hypothetical protein [Thalassospira sp. GB04J01]|uniref:hypothetical protein n=1 Tax=Thalassospira sp. GB04J01 TaxID=1485225 RepID=UPI000C9B7160|nr:hypothetical protein [Thalassospira sp. GB04J01]|tara:strand:- start:51147 stop:51569 length:423 start_codon:yes stop_codon:yes gene_type:complete
MTAHTIGMPKDCDAVVSIVTRLNDLLDVEWRILEQAQYDLLPDITCEKTLLQEELQGELQAQRQTNPEDPHAGIIIDLDLVRMLGSKLARNNVRLKAKREACLKRIRAGCAATAGDDATSYNQRGGLCGNPNQKIVSIKM